jgi:hypothetical protein
VLEQHVTRHGPHDIRKTKTDAMWQVQPTQPAAHVSQAVGFFSSVISRVKSVALSVLSFRAEVLFDASAWDASASDLSSGGVWPADNCWDSRKSRSATHGFMAHLSARTNEPLHPHFSFGQSKRRVDREAASKLRPWH